MKVDAKYKGEGLEPRDQLLVRLITALPAWELWDCVRWTGCSARRSDLPRFELAVHEDEQDGSLRIECRQVWRVVGDRRWVHRAEVRSVEQALSWFKQRSEG